MFDSLDDDADGFRWQSNKAKILTGSVTVSYFLFLSFFFAFYSLSVSCIMISLSACQFVNLLVELLCILLFLVIVIGKVDDDNPICWLFSVKIKTIGNQKLKKKKNNKGKHTILVFEQILCCCTCGRWD